MLDMAHLPCVSALRDPSAPPQSAAHAPPNCSSLRSRSSAIALAWACNGNNHNPNVVVGDDAPDDSPVATGDDSGDVGVDTGGGAYDATSDPCTLGDKVTDPVALCVQQQVLGAELQYAYVKGQGVAPGWSSAGPATRLSPATRGRTTSGSPGHSAPTTAAPRSTGTPTRRRRSTASSPISAPSSWGSSRRLRRPCGLVRRRDLLPSALGAGRVQLHRQRQRRGR